jgi:hypothetical protein
MIHADLSDFYETNFLLMKEHNFRLDEIDQMLPWERYVYISLLKQHIERKAQINAGIN